jgi:hypothetical protein
MIVEVGIAAQGVFEGRSILELEHRWPGRAVQVVVEIGVEVDVVHRLRMVQLFGRRLLRGFSLGLLLFLGLCGFALLVLVHLFEQWILHQLLGEDALKLQPGHLQELDGLLE